MNGKNHAEKNNKHSSAGLFLGLCKWWHCYNFYNIYIKLLVFLQKNKNKFYFL